MAAFLTLAVWFGVLGGTWWLWAGVVGGAEPARPLIDAVFVLCGLFLVWCLLYANVPPFMHFGPHHPTGLLGLDLQG